MTDSATLGTALASLLLDAWGAGALCGLSRSHFWPMHSAGRVPLPVRLGRRTLWRRDELTAWVAAGCPMRVRWLAICEAK